MVTGTRTCGMTRGVCLTCWEHSVYHLTAAGQGKKREPEIAFLVNGARGPVVQRRLACDAPAH